MSKEFIKQLEELEDDVLNMGRLSKDTIKLSVKALINQDPSLAKQIFEMEDKINGMELMIENKCMKLLALQQPMAKDLRMIGTCMKIITDLDRVSDLSADIADIAIKTSNEPFVKPLIDIPRMAEIVESMLDDSLTAFKNKDTELAMEMGKRDDVVDALYDQIRRELITFMIEDPRKIANASHLSFVARYLERIGDHACNIAGRVVYMVTGKRVKIE
ncbi:MAG TPA: phosphate signaling complex protein PhoU [Candidatus Syntrophoarchaeum butanivorans]|uniref:Phosphate-specific transport system accessory protein PhoU n=1 Tax=Candidatus Syntropharchaeum butanivorans TaxID=1839936 RepID=A0A1F2P5Z6_9EURY|nr:MAG: phosphate transport system regulatory protein PhoU [Candidatus Syntrophoarchaeum butanivorans]RJS72366.1 MAG: phosphate transport system regulatory protein PhoU [Candidatus Syntrophoarchaeum sp. WYZ-LMO15]HDM36843.1 phosphate signaling complex protein PhoU [Candidatus Syntrophoarchaeum butanivorans]HEC57186.1 phosphate signaling complex protein PhoU [Candidatus Syntrophoarchaeum butanivorans]